jgi:hypothetical protein
MSQAGPPRAKILKEKPAIAGFSYTFGKSSTLTAGASGEIGAAGCYAFGSRGGEGALGLLGRIVSAERAGGVTLLIAPAPPDVRKRAPEDYG